MTTSIALPAVLTADQAKQTLVVLSQALVKQVGAEVVIDASSLKHFDSSALAVLLECRRLAQAAGKDCVVSKPSDKLKALAALYGVNGLLPMASAEGEPRNTAPLMPAP